MDKQIVIPEKTWQQNPLFWHGQGDLVVPRSRPNIFIGIGVAALNQLSQAIPFDELGFLLSAEFVKRQIPDSEVFVLIADQHAWLANKFDINKAKEASCKQLALINRIIKALSLDNWTVLQAAKLFPQAQPASYEKLETRDVNLFVNHHRVGIKVGWQFGRGVGNHKTYEPHFDKRVVSILRFILTKPGLTLSPDKIHESPYICTEPATRIVLESAENVTQKLKTTVCNRGQITAVKNHLRKTVILFEMLITKLPNKIPLEDKVKLINNMIFR